MLTKNVRMSGMLFELTSPEPYKEFPKRSKIFSSGFLVLFMEAL